jgi:hypothetical protein
MAVEERDAREVEGEAAARRGAMAGALVALISQSSDLCSRSYGGRADKGAVAVSQWQSRGPLSISFSLSFSPPGRHRVSQSWVRILPIPHPYIHYTTYIYIYIYIPAQKI